jgi:polyisoprenoid-binding protein YceI
MKPLRATLVAFAALLVATAHADSPPGATAGSITFVAENAVSTANGTFHAWRVVRADIDRADPASGFVEVEVDVASIDTGIERRDEHLRSADFFDVAKHPSIAFVSTKVSDVDPAAKTAKLHGNLTMHGVTKPVVLDVAYLGTGKDPWGNVRGGFTATTTVTRKDFGLSWNETLETGGVLVGEEVEIEINVEGLLQE